MRDLIPCHNVLQMILSNRVIKTFEVSVEQFNQLRFGVAKVRPTRVFFAAVPSSQVFLLTVWVV
jgi:hypothetical protein